MTTAQIPFQQAPTDPAMKDLLDLWAKNLLLGLNCHHIGTVQSFNGAKQTATVTVNYKKTFFQLNPATGLYNAVLLDYPPLTDCPVVCLGGGAGALTFPIKQGDECLILFNDRDIDNWFSGATGAAVATPRLHSISDAIALVGVRSLANVLTDYDAARVVLKNEETLIALGLEKMKIENSETDLKTILTDLGNALASVNSDLITAFGPLSPTPNPPAVIAFSGLSSTISTAIAAIGDLLE